MSPNDHKIVQLISPKTMTNSATQTANLDCKGYDYAIITINFGAELNTNGVGPTLSLLSCDTTVATDFATVVADRSAEDLTAAKNVVYMVDTKTAKRYLRLSVTTATATNDNVTFAAIASLHRAELLPASTSAMVGSTNDVVVTV